MSNGLLAVIITIFVTGMVTGIFTGIKYKTGEDIDPNSIAIKIGKIVCSGISDPSLAHQCNSTLTLLSIVAFIAGIVEIIATISMVGHWSIGALIYIFGFIYGFMMVG